MQKLPGRNTFKRWILAPGLWEDTDGAAHFDIPAMLKDAGLPVTAQEIAECRAMLHEFLSIQSPGMKIIDRDSPDD